jgi:hippurate hydrolase
MRTVLVLAVWLCAPISVGAAPASLIDLYKSLHSSPELSWQEEATARRLAAEFDAAGFEVSTGIGGYGVVALMTNGDGPVLMLRADMDGLPVVEQTGLAFASTATTTNADGQTVGVMHACGHDVHMTALVGAARELAARRATWAGTLMLVAQPAEEVGGGARAMLGDGLFERFARPDYNVALHVSADLPAGTIGYASGFAMANVDSVDIRIPGVGGHGAYPHLTRDPVVMAAEIVMTLQTIVSREIAPIEAAVITVGSIHGGTKHNVIADEVRLQLTVRSYADETREYLLRRIGEVAIGVARTHDMPPDTLPEITIRDEYTPSVYNDPGFTLALAARLRRTLGADRVREVPPVMGGEDFARYGRQEPPIPSALLWLGAVDPAAVEAAAAAGTSLPSLHSSRFAPLPGPTITAGVTVLTQAALEVLGTPES